MSFSYVDADVIKGAAASLIGQTLRGEDIDGMAAFDAFAPPDAFADNTARHGAVRNLNGELCLAAFILQDDGLTILQPIAAGLSDGQKEPSFGLLSVHPVR